MRAKTLLCGVASVLALTASYTVPAVAQEAQGIEEIIVTARQREETLQDVPATVTVLTEDRLERAGVERAEDFIKLTPGVSLVDAAEVGDTQINIRGLNGARDAENSVAFIIDGVLMTNPAAFNREFSNLQQIEVLKGPQGALYGRNAAAGAIIVTTKMPGDELAGNVKVSAAGDSTYYATGYVGGPLTDTVSFSLGGDWRDTDGYYTNSFLGADVVDDFENYNINGRLVFEPTDLLTVDVKARYGQVDAASISFNAAFHLPDFATGFAPALDPLFGEGFASFFNEDVDDHEFVFQPNIDPTNDQEATEFSVKADYELGWASLTSWLLYSNIENSLSSDGTSAAFGFFNADDATPNSCLPNSIALTTQGVTLPPPQILLPVDGSFGADPILGPYTPTTCDGTQYQVRDQEDVSFELRLASPGDQALRWIAGLYYLTLEREVGVNLAIDRGFGVIPTLYTDNPNNPTEQLLWDEFDTDVWAVFGQLAYDATDSTEVALALRYDREEREARSLVPTEPRTEFVDFVNDGVFNGGAPLNPALDPTLNPGGVQPQSRTFTQVQPKLSIRHDVNDAVSLFASWGIGFKSGGFNNQGSAATIDVFINQPLGKDLAIRDEFDKETTSAFELGFKSQLAEGRLSLEGAIYRMDVDDMQFFEFQVGPFGLLRVVSNIDEVQLTGAEVGANFALNDYITLGGGWAYTASRIEANSVRPNTVGNDSPSTPQYTGNVEIEVDYPLGNGWDLYGGLYGSFVGETWFHTAQDEERRTLFDLGFPGLGTAEYSVTERDAYQTWDLRVGFGRNNWRVTAFGTNILDEDIVEEVILAAEFGGSFVHPGPERRWGVEFAYDF